jgi:hypothetical protein
LLASYQSVSKTQTRAPRLTAEAGALDDALDLARRLYGRLGVRDARSHHAIRSFVASLALAVRAARRDPETTNVACRNAGVQAKRIEVRVARLIAGRTRARQDQIARWANAAAYIARPPNGDEPPASWREAIRYINKRGGVRALSNLHAARKVADPLDQAGFFSYIPSEDSHSSWFTPRYIFDALDVEFDLDVASPGGDVAPWIPARHHFSAGSLERDWFGFCWMNCPYGRNIINQWTAKFAQHANGVALVPASTATEWWQELVARADMVMFLNRRLPFWNALGEMTATFPVGSSLIGIGERAITALENANRNGLGLILTPNVTAMAQFAFAAK